MTPAQLGALVAQHNRHTDPDAKPQRHQHYDDPADLLALAALPLGG